MIANPSNLPCDNDNCGQSTASSFSLATILSVGAAAVVLSVALGAFIVHRKRRLRKEQELIANAFHVQRRKYMERKNKSLPNVLNPQVTVGRVSRTSLPHIHPSKMVLQPLPPLSEHPEGRTRSLTVFLQDRPQEEKTKTVYGFI
jgi:hypothetical protein